MMTVMNTAWLHKENAAWEADKFSCQSGLRELHEAWVKAGQPLPGRAFLAGLIAGLELPQDD